MRIGDARAAWLVFVAALVACAGGAAPRSEATSTQSATEAPSEASSREAASSSGVAAPVPAPEDTSAEEPAPAPSAAPSPTYFTQVSFDLRTLPHRGARDVDPRLVSGRVELLVQRVRDSAGEPPPQLLVYRGASVFRAEFFGTEPGALSQCQRAVDAVAALRDVRATPCARIEP